MSTEEIQAGLLNALERGVSLEKAGETFINAGYPEAAVKSAMRSINEGNVSMPVIKEKEPVELAKKEMPEKIAEQIKPLPVVSPLPKEEVKEEGVSKTKIVMLVVVLVFLLILLGASFFFKDAISAWLQ